MLLIFIGIIALVTALVWLLLESDAWVPCAATILVSCILIVVGCRIESGVTIARLEVFYEVSASNYETVADKTEDLLTVDAGGTLVEGSIERAGVGETVSARLAELRDAVNSYNKQLAHLRYMDSLPLVTLAYATPPDTLAYIKLK